MGINRDSIPSQGEVRERWENMGMNRETAYEPNERKEKDGKIWELPQRAYPIGAKCSFIQWTTVTSQWTIHSCWCEVLPNTMDHFDITVDIFKVLKKKI